MAKKGVSGAKTMRMVDFQPLESLRLRKVMVENESDVATLAKTYALTYDRPTCLIKERLAAQPCAPSFDI
jgi:hypothetical protein